MSGRRSPARASDAAHLAADDAAHRLTSGGASPTGLVRLENGLPPGGLAQYVATFARIAPALGPPLDTAALAVADAPSRLVLRLLNGVFELDTTYEEEMRETASFVEPVFYRFLDAALRDSGSGRRLVAAHGEAATVLLVTDDATGGPAIRPSPFHARPVPGGWRYSRRPWADPVGLADRVARALDVGPGEAAAWLADLGSTTRHRLDSEGRAALGFVTLLSAAARRRPVLDPGAAEYHQRTPKRYVRIRAGAALDASLAAGSWTGLSDAGGRVSALPGRSPSRTLALLDVLARELVEGPGAVHIAGLGTIQAVRREVSMATNPATGAQIVVPSKVVVGFMPEERDAPCDAPQ